MNMIVLIINACLVTTPWTCKDYHLQFSAENLTPYQCVTRAMPELAKWKEEHPGWEITKFKCVASARLEVNL